MAYVGLHKTREGKSDTGQERYVGFVQSIAQLLKSTGKYTAHKFFMNSLIYLNASLTTTRNYGIISSTRFNMNTGYNMKISGPILVDKPEEEVAKVLRVFLKQGKIEVEHDERMDIYEFWWKVDECDDMYVRLTGGELQIRDMGKMKNTVEWMYAEFVKLLEEQM